MTRLFLLPLFLVANCDVSGCLPTSPSGSPGSLQWSPYMGIHASGEAREAYREALPLLIRNGNLRGARVEIVPREGLPNETIKMIGSLGIELVGLINNNYLFDPNIETRIDEIYAAYPEIIYFQVGNEITNFTSMSIVQYMVALRRVYDHSQRNYPSKILITQSPRGTGDYSGELEEMVKLGLKEMSSQKLIIGVNVYSDYAIVGYSDKIRKYLSGYRVWVMETGNDIPSQHVQFVQNFYPQLMRSLRAERIYWYVMWGGDVSGDSGYSLITNVLNPPVVYSPLFNVLAGVE